MHDPSTLICSFGPFSLWHEDPCRGPGGDDSCGWFMRAHHGDKAVFARIIDRFDSDFDKVFASDSGKTYYTGMFYPTSGDPKFSAHAIVLNWFFLAALEHFKKGNGHHPRKEASRFCQKNLFEILLFAENPFDSLYDGITGTFGAFDKREHRIRAFAGAVYGWILREDRPWYRHPRWHVHHWRLSVRWRSFLPGWLDRKVNPGCYAACSKPI